jgi:DNA-binding NarL/FixJ family response regulator
LQQSKRKKPILAGQLAVHQGVTWRPHLVFARDDSRGSTTRLGEPPRILVVEDDYLVGMQVETALIEAGFEVAASVASAEEAIRTAASAPITLAVMDIRLAGKIDGVEAALELFRQHGIRCIFATAHSDAAVQARAQPAQPLSWLSKPYTMASLVAAVRRGLKALGG